jgi:plastocyanin
MTGRRHRDGHGWSAGTLADPIGIFGATVANRNHSHYYSIPSPQPAHPQSAKAERDMSSRHITHVLVLTLAVAVGIARGADVEVQLVIKGHRFEPAELKVPAGQRVKLSVHNQDSTAEEFESHPLGREKLIPAGSKATIFIGPLKPGTYKFFGEYHQATAQGVVIAE